MVDVTGINLNIDMDLDNITPREELELRRKQEERINEEIQDLRCKKSRIISEEKRNLCQQVIQEEGLLSNTGWNLCVCIDDITENKIFPDCEIWLITDYEGLEEYIELVDPKYAQTKRNYEFDDGTKFTIFLDDGKAKIKCKPGMVEDVIDKFDLTISDGLEVFGMKDIDNMIETIENNLQILKNLREEHGKPKLTGE